MVNRNTPFTYTCRNGCLVRSMMNDLSSGIHITGTNNDPTRLAEAVVEAIAYWATTILPEVLKDGKGYQGYDTIKCVTDMLNYDEDDEDDLGLYEDDFDFDDDEDYEDDDDI